ncbi:MAG: amidohydrolase family protein [Prolixibacteraceae bacterium]|nr:amidohydrolase family protein [Prolixibacteraceae bacterium]
MNAINTVFILISILFLYPENEYYSIADFQNVEKTDSHFHIYSDKSYAVEAAIKDNFKLLSINTFSDGCERVFTTNRNCNILKEKYPEDFEFTAAFCLDGWDDKGWVENTIGWIDKSIRDGAVAVKVWKNIGMEFKDEDGSLIMIDDPQFDPVFKHLAEKRIPLVGHLGEPKNCWLPLKEMTTKNDSSYFAENPQYHMFLHPDMPSYEEQMAARDRMLDKNPNLIFIGCHLASLEWDVDVLATFLDRYPNSAVDMAARMGQLFYQTRENREKIRSFFIKYQDRILYGTDIIDREQADAESIYKRMHNTWLTDWEYLVTDNRITSNLIDGEFKGLKLPKEVVNKIYSQNAKKWYKGFE